MQAYSDPKRAEDPYALPDVEVWRDHIYESVCCDTDHPESHVLAASDQPCFTCGYPAKYRRSDRAGWWWWFCFPGCLPDSDPVGPFATEAEALADCREQSGFCPHGKGEDERCDECPAQELWVIQNAAGSYLYESMRATLHAECSCAAYASREHAERAAARYPGFVARRLTDDESREWSYGKSTLAVVPVED